jgi:heme exporter protein D
MNWSSFGDFVQMGGYGLYVWGSFGMCALVLAGECLSLRWRAHALRTLAVDDTADALHDGGGR